MDLRSQARVRLLALSEDQIRQIVAGDAGLCSAWARTSRVSQDELSRGKNRAVKAVSAAIRREPRQFIKDLGAYCAEFLDNVRKVTDVEDSLAYTVRGLAGIGGPPMAKLCVACVAEANMSISTEVTERLDELLALADSPLVPPSDDASEADAEQGAEVTVTDHTEAPPVSDLIDEINRLRDDGRDLATTLRSAADAIERGEPTQGMSELASIWSAQVRALLDGAHSITTAVDSLDALEMALRELQQEEASRLTAAKKAIETVSYLRSQGLSAVIPGTLAELGFESLEQAEELLGKIHPNPLSAHGFQHADAGAASPGDLEPAVEVTDRSEVGDLDSGEQSTQDAEPDSKSGEPFAPECVSAGRQDSEPVTPIDESTMTGSGDAGLARESGVQPVIGVGTSTQQRKLTTGTKTDEIESPPGGDDQHGTFSTSPTSVESSQASERARDDTSTGLPEQPWDHGDGLNPPLIAKLLLADEFALACHVAEAASAVSGDQRMLLRLTCAAARCTSAALEPVLPQLLPNDSQVDTFGTDEIRVLLGAALRAGLRLGYAPLGLQTLIDRAELADLGLEPVIQALASAVQRGRTRESTASADSSEGLASKWAELGEEARRLQVLLGRKNLIWGRASKVLRHIVREAQPLGHALATTTDLCGRGIDSASASEWSDIETLAMELHDQGKRDRMIAAAHRAVSSGPQRREVIEASARDQLRDNLLRAGGLLSQVTTLRRAILNVDDIKGVESEEYLDRAMAAAPPSLTARTVGDAALIGLIEWRRTPTQEFMFDSLDEALDQDLLAASNLPRDIDGRPTRQPTPKEVALLLEKRPPHAIIAEHLLRGDLAAARHYILDRSVDGEFDDDLLSAGRDGQRLHDAALADAELGAARLRSLYMDEFARELSGEIDSVRVPIKDRFDLSITKLKSIKEKADVELEALHADLLQRTAATSAADDDKNRVVELIERRDETLAVEFLTRIESGQSLPAVPTDHGDDFNEFFPAVVDVAYEAHLGNLDPLIAARSRLTNQIEPEDRQLRDGLRGWAGIKREKRKDFKVFKARVAEVLRMVGLIPRSTEWIREISRIQRSGYVTYRVLASPVDRSYVPQFGTQAHSYDITFVWDRATPQRLLDFVDERNRSAQANVIFYFGVLSTRERAHLRMLTLAGRGKGFSPLVIDEAVIAWLTSRQEPGWRFTQRVTLPFTTINPYSPFAGGEVPDEVFVGRDGERQRIEGQTDSMFVYGGRQLGKSALLRRVDRLFNQSAHHADEASIRTGNVALYIDLKAAGIGEAREPAELWPLLGERLTHARVIPAKGVRASTAQDVTTQITSWLNAQSDNRLLILLDEADNFLTVDANAGASSTRGAFPVLQALKGVMATSNRRFKVVFAGLHQVQRFHDSSNTPVAHGGSDILIGPLESRDAYSLVVDPMNALGYAFANPELVWRLLLVTNYQASLVQIVCEALVRHLQDRPLPTEGGRIIIGGNDIRAVCEKEEVQQLIAQRFRWTINLDSRYRVIALVVAHRSRAVNEPAAAFSVDDLRDYCEYFWQVGFSRDLLSRKEFERYLAEMVGLGVLHRQGDRYGLRSPNIIRMLGSQQSLEEELQDAEQHLEPAFEYNPAMARQTIGDSAGFWMPRSPLTDLDLAALLDDQEPVQIVCGSEALAVDRVAGVVSGAAEEREFRTILAKTSEIPELEQHHFGRRTQVVIDLSAGDGPVELQPIIKKLQNRNNLGATIVVNATARPWTSDWGVPVHYLRRWSVDGLRAWYESPFDSPLLRQKLFRVTSGWPRLIEKAMTEVRDGKSAESALDDLIEFLAQPQVAEIMLATSAIDRDVATQWSTWFTTALIEGLTGSEVVPLADLSEALGRDADGDLIALEALDLVSTDDDGWVLDRVITAAADRLLR